MGFGDFRITIVLPFRLKQICITDLTGDNTTHLAKWVNLGCIVFLTDQTCMNLNLVTNETGQIGQIRPYFQMLGTYKLI